MNFTELFDASRFPKLSQKDVTKPKYQISADEYNALLTALKNLTESGEVTYQVSFDIETPAIVNTSVTSPQFVFTPRFAQRRGASDPDYQSTMVEYTVTAAVNGGSPQTIKSGTVATGLKVSIPIKSYLVAGSSTVFAISAKETYTETVGMISYAVTYTSLSLVTDNYRWWEAWKQSDTGFSLGTFGIKGAANKELHVRVSVGNYSKEYTKNIGTAVGDAYSISTNDGLVFPTISDAYKTGTVECWLSSSSVETDHVVMPLMVVKSTAERTAKMVVVRSVAEKLINDAQNNVFKYAFYSGGSTSGSLTASIDGVGDTFTANTETANTYTTNVSIDEGMGYYVKCRLTCGTSKVEYSILLDNASSYPSTAGAVWYMNPSNRSNGQSNAMTVINNVNQSSVSATWEKMVFDGDADGWITDSSNGRKCLYVPARGRADISYMPFQNGVGTGKCVEILYKSMNVSDYADNIISICDNPASDTFVGIRIKPNCVLIHSMMRSSTSNDRVQSYDLMDEELVHLVIDFNPNFKNGNGAATIYVNGVKKVVVPYTNVDSWAQSGHILLGSDNADLYVYGIKMYNQSLGYASALTNYIAAQNTQADKAAVYAEVNSILDGDAISYDKIKGHYNVFTVEMLTGSASTYHDELGALPTFGHDKTYSGTCNFEMLYADGYGLRLENQLIEGQGTTSMNYFLWNLRWRIDKNPNKECGAVKYLSGGAWTTDSQKKSVKFFKNGVSNLRITAKKNYASSSQGHKMGTTAAFHDLHDAVVGPNEAGGRVAVKQVPAYGFLKMASEDGGYVYYFIGQYTIGADKGDKPTFGWDGTYKSKLISMEGTDHDPKLTSFAYPWNSQVVVNGAYLSVQTSSSDYQNGWEIGNVLGLETDSSKSGYSASAIKSAMTSHWKNAYEVAYKNSTRIKPVPEGSTMSQINANASAFMQAAGADGLNNEYFEFWDSNYDLWYYDLVTKKYVKSGVNLQTQCGTPTGSTDDAKNEFFKAKRRALFAAEWGNYWHTDDTVFNFAFQLIWGASDNFAKNSYPYNLDPSGGLKWRWVNDDLDTIFSTDNQGLDTKTYSIEYDDLTDAGNAFVFKGAQSTFWTLVSETCEDDIKAKGKAILERMAAVAKTSGRGISRFGSGNIGKLMQFFYDYYWDKTADTFKKSGYNLDMEYAYEEAYKYYNKGYNPDVNPLEQERGDHEEAEVQWVYRRMVYCMSRFGMGAFDASVGYTDTSLGVISLRTQTAQTFSIVPAIDMMPAILSGQSGTARTDSRVMAGETVALSAGGSNSNIYIVGSNWITDIGDMKDIKVDSSTDITIGGKRLKKIKLGDATASAVTSTLSGVNIGSSPCLEEIDARNLSSLSKQIDLSGCPRLKKAYFEGTNVPAVTVPEGAKVEVLHLPGTLLNLTLKKMWYLEDFEIGGYEALKSINIERCMDGVYDNVLNAISPQFYEAIDFSSHAYLYDSRTYKVYGTYEEYESDNVPEDNTKGIIYRNDESSIYYLYGHVKKKSYSNDPYLIPFEEALYVYRKYNEIFYYLNLLGIDSLIFDPIVWTSKAGSSSSYHYVVNLLTGEYYECSNSEKHSVFIYDFLPFRYFVYQKGEDLTLNSVKIITGNENKPTILSDSSLRCLVNISKVSISKIFSGYVKCNNNTTISEFDKKSIEKCGLNYVGEHIPTISKLSIYIDSEWVGNSHNVRIGDYELTYTKNGYWSVPNEVYGLKIRNILIDNVLSFAFDKTKDLYTDGSEILKESYTESCIMATEYLDYNQYINKVKIPKTGIDVVSFTWIGASRGSSMHTPTFTYKGKKYTYSGWPSTVGKTTNFNEPMHYDGGYIEIHLYYNLKDYATFTISLNTEEIIFSTRPTN